MNRWGTGTGYFIPALPRGHLAAPGIRPERGGNGYDIALEYGAFPDRDYDSPAIWGDATKIRAIMSGSRGSVESARV